MSYTANAADAGQADAADQTDQSIQQQDQADNADTTATDQPIITAPAVSPVPTAPSGQFDQDMQHLMNHLGDLKAFLVRFEHKVEGKIGDVVAFLKANL